MDFRLNGGKVYQDGRLIPMDVALLDNRLVPVGMAGNANVVSFSLNGAVILPGFVDVHVHLREPGFFYKETIATGTRASARGGYRHVCAMPNVNPAPDTLENLQPQLAAIQKDALIRVTPYGAITMGRKGQGTLAQMEDMAPYVCGFSDDGTGVCDEALMEQAMRKAKKLGKMIVAHCEDMTLIPQGGSIHAGSFAKEHDIPGIPSISEYEPIRRDLELVRKTGCAYHVCHISCKESVELIRQAKAEGLDVTCETGPHYLLMCQDDLKDEGRFKMNPPLRDKEDQQALIEGLLDGTIDMIATDHAPHSTEEKTKGLRGSAMGVVGIETAFPLMYTYFVKTGRMSLEKLMDLMAYAPARRFGLTEGAENSFTVWDLEAESFVNPEDFLSKGRSTPFEGWKINGKCLMTVVDGQIVYREGEKL